MKILLRNPPIKIADIHVTPPPIKSTNPPIKIADIHITPPHVYPHPKLQDAVKQSANFYSLSLTLPSIPFPKPV